MDELEFTVRSTGASKARRTNAPAGTKKGDRIDGEVVLHRSDLGGRPVLVVGPPKPSEGWDF